MEESHELKKIRRKLEVFSHRADIIPIAKEIFCGPNSYNSTEQHSSLPMQTPPEPRFRSDDWAISLAFLGAIMTTLITWFPPQTIITAILGLTTLFAFGIYPAFHFGSLLSRKLKPLKYSIFILWLFAVVRIGVSIWPPQSHLSITSIATNLSSAKRTLHGGIEWQDGWSELRVMINNPGPFSIQNVDLSIMTRNSLILAMEQLSDVHNCEMKAVGSRPDNGIWLQNPDGTKGIWLSLKDMMRELPVLTPRWSVYCPRLIGNTELELILAVPMASPPTTLTVSGYYQLMPNEGSKNVKVNVIAHIQK
jgi:hypothetical protein